MSLEALRRKRSKWVEANRENNFEEGIKRLLTNLYPDHAHFIYELLQNAEDAQATEVRFILKEDRIEFEHDGSRLFTIGDLEAITSIGDSHKTDDPTNIGKFGVGFKAVFAYTSTPKIKSGAYHFRIRDLVVPDTHGLSSDVLNAKKTQFVFPFDNPEKPMEKAYAEIEKELRALDESTLIFLSNIRRIEYIMLDSELGYLERNDSSENRIEVLVMHPDYTAPVSKTYLRLMKDVEVNDEDGNRKRCRIAIAYGLEHTPRQEWKIKPLDRGQVCIYFPALNAQSNLKFHLHAPFASTVARDSIRDCEANDNLRDELAQLIAESMSVVRDQELLTVEFLTVLPNDKDNLPSFFEPIMTELIKAFQTEELVPMKQGGHAAACGVFMGSAQLSNLVTDRDLATIQGGKYCQPIWIANPSQRNQREDTFLSMLNISRWTTHDLVDVMINETERMAGWLAGKSIEWHQELYSTLGEYLEELEKKQGYRWDPYIRDHRPHDSVYQDTRCSLSKVPIVRLSEGTYEEGRDCFFPSDGVEYDVEFPRVASGVYANGVDETQQDCAYRFLAEIGVKELDESHRVEAILKERYSDEDAGSFDEEEYFKDLRRFAQLVNEDPDQSDLIRQYRVFYSEEKKWRTPDESFVDSPVIDTGLKAYFEALTDKSHRKWALAGFYRTCGLETDMLREFLEAVGVQTMLTVKNQMIPWVHPERQELQSFPGTRRTYTGINDDYDIEELVILLEHPSIEKAKLIWRTMCSLPDKCLSARYRPNQQNRVKERASSLVHFLRNATWVPQNDKNSVAFTTPRDARVELLPQQRGFPYDRGQKWLEAIEFGSKPRLTSEDTPQMEQAADFLGTDEEGLARAQEFLKLPPELQKEALDKMPRQEPGQSFPTHESGNRTRRDAKIKEQARSAPDRGTEVRDRSVSVAREAIKSETEPYMRALYTENDELYCQICRCPMPFRLSDGKHYFEMVDFLKLKLRHYQNYLALCPNHAAMFQHANSSKGSEVELVNKMEPGEVELFIELAGEKTVVVFTQTHLEDLKVLIGIEESDQD